MFTTIYSTEGTHTYFKKEVIHLVIIVLLERLNE